MYSAGQILVESQQLKLILDPQNFVSRCESFLFRVEKFNE